MIDFTRPHAQCNTETSILIQIAGNEIPLGPSQLVTDEQRNSVMRRCQESHSCSIHHWDRVINWPEPAQEAIVSILAELQKYRPVGFYNHYGDQSGNLYEATLSLSVSGRDLETVAAATRIAILSARYSYPQAAAQAAEQIYDWLSSQGIRPETKRRLETQIRGASEPENSGNKTSTQDAARSVLAHLQDQRVEPEFRTPPIYYFQQNFYLWDRTGWIIVEEPDVYVTRILLRVLPNKDLTQNFIKGVIGIIKAETSLQLPAGKLPVMIMDEEQKEIRHVQCLNLENGMLDVFPMGNGSSPGFLEHDSRVFGAPKLKYHYDPGADCPGWRQTLNEILPCRGEGDYRQRVLQELFGYTILVGDLRHEKFAVLYGDGANGKSVVLDVLRNMLGPGNVSNMPLDALANEFRLGDMFGKMANIATDMQRLQKVDEGTLKQLVSGEELQINRKHKEPMTMRPTAKLFFATNSLPSFSDTSEGIWRRMIIIPFLHHFAEGERDRHLAQRLVQAELPGILNWSIEGALRLSSQGRFTDCRECQDCVSSHRYDSDPLRQFLDECCQVDPRSAVDCMDLFAAYRAYCHSIGRFPKSNPEVGKQLARDTRFRKERRSRPPRNYYYQGLRLHTEVISRIRNTSSPRGC